MKRMKETLGALTILLTFSSQSFAAQECPKGITLKKGSKTCAYDVVLHAANTVRGFDVFELGSEAVVNLIAALGYPVGSVARSSYYQEGNRYIVRLRPSASHESYLMCAHRWEVWSETGTKNWDNRNKVTLSEGYYEWELLRSGIGRGRNWYKADFVWVSHHPGFVPDKKVCESIADSVLVQMRNQRPKNKETHTGQRHEWPGRRY